jgi:hypothetical protein
LFTVNTFNIYSVQYVGSRRKLTFRGVNTYMCNIYRGLSREVTSGAKSRQFRSKWTPLGVHVCLDE